MAATTMMVPVELVGAIIWKPQFGAKLKSIRTSLGMSRLKLRDKIKEAGYDISPQNLQKIEDGFKTSEGLEQPKTIPIETLQAICGALDYPVEELLSLKSCSH